MPRSDVQVSSALGGAKYVLGWKKKVFLGVPLGRDKIKVEDVYKVEGSQNGAGGRARLRMYAGAPC